MWAIGRARCRRLARVLIVAEAMHDTARHDVTELQAALAGELQSLWGAKVRSAMLTPDAPRFDSGGPPS